MAGNGGSDKIESTSSDTIDEAFVLDTAILDQLNAF